MRRINRKLNPTNVAFETRAKNILKGELKRRGIAYADLAKKLSKRGVKETERNLSNKISRGGFSAAFFLLCLETIECGSLRIRNDD